METTFQSILAESTTAASLLLTFWLASRVLRDQHQAHTAQVQALQTDLADLARRALDRPASPPSTPPHEE